MKEQRWPGDYETKEQEFRNARSQEQMGMTRANQDLGNDYIADGEMGLDHYQCEQLEPSACQMLDMVGMQPHSREYIERELNCARSDRKFEMVMGQSIDYPGGIQFSGRP
jgi:hypothetical protein